MASRYLLFLADDEARERGEISFFDDAGEATGHAESLLEAGYEQDRIRIFGSDEMEIYVTQKPVVSFAGPDNSTNDLAGAPTNAEDNGASEAKGDVAGVKDGVRLSSLFKKGD